MERYDVIVVGGGHAGCEAAVAASSHNLKVLLITISMDRLAWMSCNPAIGGLAKGHLVKELAVLGGVMPGVIDKSGIQFRKLNSKKGRAVQSTRVQADKVLYSIEMKNELSKVDNIHFFQAEVSSLIIEDKNIVGVNTCEGISIYGKAVVLCLGTFLKGRLHYGDATVEGGRSGEKSSEELSVFLKEKTEHSIRRFKTGTPARFDGRSIDFTGMHEQLNDESVKGFGPEEQRNSLNKKSCFLTRTSVDTHKIIVDNIKLAPLYSGKISSKGPRYCPSIEDKVVRFPDKSSHQIFLEPEGEDNIEFYANGVSTGLPIDIQERFYRTIKGMENSRIIRPAYAVEYDCVDSHDLKLTLESKYLNNLYFAGQINGTSGYEEAAVQGFVAGANAARRILNIQELIFPRNDSYIGVMIDDIITKGVDEPYRMFTSRAENRIVLRENNADLRLYKFAKENGFIDDKIYNKIKTKWETIYSAVKLLDSINIKPTVTVNEKLEKINSSTIKQRVTAKDLLRRPEVSYKDVIDISGDDMLIDFAIYDEEIEIEVKYEGYIRMQQNDLKFDSLDTVLLSTDTDYNKLDNLSKEVREKLDQVKPQTLAQALRIPGVTPAAIDVLLVYKKRGTI
jgi:tRNA uridine 5-carboxymethylaminomethyl modification enzyme